MLIKILRRDEVTIHFVNKNILLVLSKVLTRLLEFSTNDSIRVSLVKSCVTILANLLGDDDTNDTVCDKLLKETCILEILVKEIPFTMKYAYLYQYIHRDLTFFYHNLSLADDMWCISKLLTDGIMEAIFKLMLTFKDYPESV